MHSKDFVTYRRNSGEGFSTYIVEFKRKHPEIEKYDMNLPTGVLVFFLLQAANLTPDHEKLVRTATKLKYKDMREKIQKVFDETGDNVVDCVPVKQKVAYIWTMVGVEVLEATLIEEEAIHFVGLRKLNLRLYSIVQIQLQAMVVSCDVITVNRSNILLQHVHIDRLKKVI